MSCSCPWQGFGTYWFLKVSFQPKPFSYSRSNLTCISMSLYLSVCPAYWHLQIHLRMWDVGVGRIIWMHAVTFGVPNSSEVQPPPIFINLVRSIWLKTTFCHVVPIGSKSFSEGCFLSLIFCLIYSWPLHTRLFLCQHCLLASIAQLPLWCLPQCIYRQQPCLLSAFCGPNELFWQMAT